MRPVPSPGIIKLRAAITAARNPGTTIYLRPMAAPANTIILKNPLLAYPAAPGGAVGIYGQIFGQSSLAGFAAISGIVTGQIAPQSTLAGFAALIGMSYGQIAPQSSVLGFAAISGIAHGQIIGQSSLAGFSALSGMTTGQIATQSMIEGFASINGMVSGQIASQATIEGFAALIGMTAGQVSNAEATLFGSISMEINLPPVDGSNLKSRRFLLTVIPPEPGRTRPSRSRRTNRKLYKDWIERQ